MIETLAVLSSKSNEWRRREKFQDNKLHNWALHVFGAIDSNSPCLGFN